MLRKLDGKALLASKCKGSFHLLLSSMYFFLGGGGGGGEKGVCLQWTRGVKKDRRQKIKWRGSSHRDYGVT